jgi:hypothetical protein
MPSSSSLMPETMVAQAPAVGSKAAVYKSIGRLARWLEERDYRGYDTFDGLNARFVRPAHVQQRTPSHRLAPGSTKVSAESTTAL